MLLEVTVHVLVVEDEPSVAEAAAHGLARFGFTVTTVATAAEALDPATYEAADVIILDLGLPDLDGYEICRRLRKVSDVPIIVMTGRGDEMDRVMGLELGADDYVVKPVGFHELVARIRAITRRVSQQPATSNGPRQSGTTNQLHIDHTARRATINGEPMVLTAKEFDLLSLLAANPDVVLRRDAIIRAIWGTDYYGSTKTLDTHVSALRRKLGDHNWIESVRRVGFRWVNQ